MAYQPSWNAQLLNAEQTGIPDYAKAIQSGFQTSADKYKPAGAASDLLQKMLQAKISQPYADHAEEAFRTDMDYKRALMQQAMNSSNPFMRLAGPAKEAYSLELLKNQLGEDSPAYQTAKQQYDLEQESQKGLNTYRQGLAESMNKRSSSNLGKLNQVYGNMLTAMQGKA